MIDLEYFEVHYPILALFITVYPRMIIQGAFYGSIFIISWPLAAFTVSSSIKSERLYGKALSVLIKLICWPFALIYCSVLLLRQLIFVMTHIILIPLAQTYRMVYAPSYLYKRKLRMSLLSVIKQMIKEFRASHAIKYNWLFAYMSCMPVDEAESFYLAIFTEASLKHESDPDDHDVKLAEEVLQRGFFSVGVYNAAMQCPYAAKLLLENLQGDAEDPSLVVRSIFALSSNELQNCKGRQDIPVKVVTLIEKYQPGIEFLRSHKDDLRPPDSSFGFNRLFPSRQT